MSEAQKKNDEALPPLRRFWKSRRDLPSVVWNGSRNKAKFEFVRGVLDTRDQQLAEELIDLGYMEVELDDGELVKPPLTDAFDLMPEPAPIKGRRVPAGRDAPPRYRPKRQQSRAGSIGDSTPRELSVERSVVDQPRPVER